MASEDMILNRKLALEALRSHNPENQIQSLVSLVDPRRSCALGTMALGLGYTPAEVRALGTKGAAAQLARDLGVPLRAVSDIPVMNDKLRRSETEIADRLEDRLDRLDSREECHD